jgi:hypothetical protein
VKRCVFADTFYWYGLANRRDQWHPFVLQAKASLGVVEVVTTDEVLTEFLAAMSGNPLLRLAAQTLVNGFSLMPVSVSFHNRARPFWTATLFTRPVRTRATV